MASVTLSAVAMYSLSRELFVFCLRLAVAAWTRPRPRPIQDAPCERCLGLTAWEASMKHKTAVGYLALRAGVARRRGWSTNNSSQTAVAVESAIKLRKACSYELFVFTFMPPQWSVCLSRDMGSVDVISDDTLIMGSVEGAPGRATSPYATIEIGV